MTLCSVEVHNQYGALKHYGLYSSVGLPSPSPRPPIPSPAMQLQRPPRTADFAEDASAFHECRWFFMIKFSPSCTGVHHKHHRHFSIGDGCGHGLWCRFGHGEGSAVPDAWERAESLTRVIRMAKQHWFWKGNHGRGSCGLRFFLGWEYLSPKYKVGGLNWRQS